MNGTGPVKCAHAHGLTCFCDARLCLPAEHFLSHCANSVQCNSAGRFLLTVMMQLEQSPLPAQV